MSADLQEMWSSAGGDVPAHWTFVRLEELLQSPKSIAVGVMYPDTHDPSGVPLIKVANVKNGRVTGEPEYRISEAVDHEYRRTRLSGDELLITLVGNPGDCAIVEESMAGWNAARALAVVRLKDPALRPWLRYVLLSQPAKHLIESRLNTTVQKTLNIKDIKNLPIPVAPACERRGIVDVSSLMELKINTSNEVNQTLEQIAQAIFKSWFVDFEPVRAKMAILEAGGSEKDALLASMRAISAKSDEQLQRLKDEQPERYAELRATAELFPSAMQESELGEMPEGWEVGDLSELFELHRGFDLPQSKRVEGEVPIYAAGGVHGTHNVHKMEPPGVITGRSGVIGDVYLSLSKYWPLNTTLYVREFRGCGPFYAYHLLKSLDLKSFNSGSAVPSLNRNFVHAVKVFLPDPCLLSKFEDLVGLFFEQIVANESQNDLLAGLRDTLLPKLLAGELTIPEAEEQVAEVADA